MIVRDGARHLRIPGPLDATGQHEDERRVEGLAVVALSRLDRCEEPSRGVPAQALHVEVVVSHACSLQRRLHRPVILGRIVAMHGKPEGICGLVRPHDPHLAVESDERRDVVLRDPHVRDRFEGRRPNFVTARRVGDPHPGGAGETHPQPIQRVLGNRGRVSVPGADLHRKAVVDGVLTSSFVVGESADADAGIGRR